MREALLSTHFTDTATRQIFKQINQYNEREFEETAEIIKCRKVHETKIIKSSTNEDIVSTTTIYTFTKVNDKDTIDGKDVLSITEWKSLLDNQVVAYQILI